jgi:cytidine deaminase
MNSIAADEFCTDGLASDLRQATAGLLARLARKRRHHLACGMLLDGNVTICGINIVSNLGPATTCAEQTTLGESLKLWPGLPILLILTLRATFDLSRPDEMVTPCGRCREALFEYAPGGYIVLPGADGQHDFEFVPVRNLLPAPFYRRGNGAPLQ